MRFGFLATLAGAGLSAVSFGQVIKRTSDPAVSPDGSTVVFAWQDDLWSVPTEGGAARRLTVNDAEESFPAWSPDGKWVVFASNRYGSLDVFRMRPDGTGVERLNFESSNDYPTCVGADGTVYGYSTAWGRIGLFSLKPGRDLVQLTIHPFEMFYYADVSPDGRSMVFNTAGSPSHWRVPGKAGSNTAEVWSAAVGTPLGQMTQVTRNDRSDLFPRYLDGETLAIVSNRGGAPNIWTIDTKGGRAKAVTSFVDGTVRGLTVSRSARVGVFQKDSEIWSVDFKTGSAKPIVVSAPDDSRRIPVIETTLTGGISNYSVSPNGKLLVAEARGDIFLLPSAGGTTRQLTTNPRQDSSPQWLDDESVLYVSAGSESRRTLRVLKTDGSSREFYAGANDALAPVVSPDRKWVAFHSGNRDLMVVPSSGGVPTRVFSADFSTAYYGASAFRWTPDSSMLAVASTESRSIGLYLVPVSGGQPVLVTRVGKGSSVPGVTPDGRTMFFGATQGNDFSEIRASTQPLYAVDLAPRGMTFSEDDLDKVNDPPAKADGKVEVKVVAAGLADRLRKFGSLDVGGVWPGQGGSSIFANVDGQLSIVDVSSGSSRPVAGVTGGASDVSVFGSRVYVLQRGTLSILGQQGPVPVRFSVTVRRDQSEEESALFDEAWWAMKNLFYDPSMHGKDWDATKRKFGAMVPFCTSRGDFYDLMEELVQSLDSSHQGATSSEVFRASASETTGWLGVDFDPAQAALGRYVVSHVYSGGPSVNPECELAVGDVVVGINGTKLGGPVPLSLAMRGTVGRKTMVEAVRGGKTVVFATKPISFGTVAGLAYVDWVKWNRSQVHSLSGGKLGYIHIRGMDEPSLDTFLTEIATEMEGKSGLVVDVRYNGGGYTSHIILNVMRKMPWLIRTGRDLPGLEFSENMYRGNSLELPAACLTNEYSFSNAEIFSEGFRQMKLGPIVGEATGGAVIGTSSYPLFDGGAIRMPASGAYTVGMENLEGNGREPMFSVPWDPNLWMSGRDSQLERAVQELVKALRPG